MTVLLLVKPAVWRHARRRTLIDELVAGGAEVLTGHDARTLRAEVAAALQAGCDVLFSEDLQHEQVFDGRITVLNPFLAPA